MMSEGKENSVNQGAISNAGAIQPIPARNLQDMLRYTTAVTANADEGSSQDNPTPMDDESKRFLSEALQSMTTDVIAQLKAGIENIDSLVKADYISEEDCDAAFEYVLDLVDKIDFANDFYKIGGFHVFTPCLSSSLSLMRWRCCELIAELCQNNPFCQDKCLTEGYLTKLTSLLETDSDEIVRIKALLAVSCLVRESEAALKEFVNQSGCSILLRCLQSDSEKLKIKASFLLSSLCAQTPQIKEDLQSMGFVEQLIAMIIQNKSVNNIVEHLLSALQALVTDFPPAEVACRRPDLQLKSLLLSIIENGQGLDETKEIIEYSQKILQSVFEDNEDSIEEDR